MFVDACAGHGLGGNDVARLVEGLKTLARVFSRCLQRYDHQLGVLGCLLVANEYSDRLDAVVSWCATTKTIVRAYPNSIEILVVDSAFYHEIIRRPKER